jgi:DNA polymerase III alpha subunit/intein/homing endonuclease
MSVDSTTKFWQYLDVAEKLEMKAFCFSEHGSVMNWIKKKQEVEKRGMKYIHSNEIYVTEYIDKERGLIRDNMHYILIGRNLDGVKELNKLTSISNNREDGHYYYNPRLSLDEVMNTSDNIIMTSACLASPLWRSIRKDNKEMLDTLLDFFVKNKHRMFLEIQYHSHPEQIEFNRWLYDFSKNTGIPLIAGTDTHSLNKEHAAARKILMKAKKATYGDEDLFDLTFKSFDELVEMFKQQNSIPSNAYMEAIHNTNIMADMVESFKMDDSPKYPKLYDNPEEVFKEKINTGIKVRGINKFDKDKKEEYFQRIREEFDTYKKLGAIDYMLLLDNIISWCNSNDIYQGYSRGSVSGSEIAYCMGITEMDSIKHKLNFIRFMNPDRVTLPDVDMDFPPSRRKDVIDYVASLDNIYFSEIITFNTVALKGAIREVGRALDMPLEEVDEIAKNIEQRESHYREKYPELFKYVDLINGVIVSMGSHPSGFLVSPIPLDENIGLCYTKESKYPVSQINMKELEELKYVKLDILGLDNIETVNETCKLAGIERLTPDNINANDEDVWQSIHESPLGVFQWESSAAWGLYRRLFSKETIHKIKSKNDDFSFMDLFSAGNAALRPSGDSYRDKMCMGEFADHGFEPLNKFLAETMGQMVYQEQIMQWLVEFCGFSMSESDNVRRCVEENTLVMMGNGDYRKIKDINVGDKVMSYSDDGISQPKEVTNVFNNGKKSVYRISTIHGRELLATGDHKVLTQRGFLEVKDLTKNDTMMTPTKINSIKDSLLPQERLSQDEMFLLGMLIGDGTIHKFDSDGYKQRPSFTNSEMLLINKFKQCVNSRTRKGNYEFDLYEQNGKTVEKIYNIKVASKKGNEALYNLLKKHDLLHKAADKKISEEIMNYPIGDKLSSFLAGLFNTDGGSYESYLDYSTISEKLANQIQSLLLKYNIYSYINKGIVPDYNYYCYRLLISQKNALERFGVEILPFMVGEKVGRFTKAINNATANDIKYNYMLPNECKNEILRSSIHRNISMRSIGKKISNGNVSDLVVHKAESGITDVKARSIIQHLYCPLTYKILHSEYQPLRVKKIQNVGEKAVYDIEVKDNHNYIANGLIVHNCIAKKVGTEEVLPDIKKRFVSNMKDKFNMEESKSEEIVSSFLTVIDNASSYGFSVNHSQAYSYIGYVNAYLRYYYPLEYLTTLLNIKDDNIDKTGQISNYASTKGIEIKPIKFRRSSSSYSCNKDENAIYKGLNSVKFLNEKIAEELFELGKNQYDTFIDLLIDITENTSVNTRQLEILIKLNFFNEFGGNNELLQIYNLFSSGDNQYKKTYVEKTKIKRIEALKQQEREVKETLQDKTLPIHEAILFMKEMLGYADIKYPNAKDWYVIVNIDKKYTPKLTIYDLTTAEEKFIKVDKKKFYNGEEATLKIGDIIKITETQTKPRKKLVDGRWTDLEEKEFWLVSCVVKK